MIYIQAPLPFQGQKRDFLVQFRQVIKKYPKDTVFVDLFGGSGLLSHTIKTIYPTATVVYNDFDNYSKRLLNVATTNEILAQIREITKDAPKEKRLNEAQKERIIKILKQAEIEGKYIDYYTISTSILFTMNYFTSISELEKAQLYNRCRISNYDANGYLDGLEIVRQDYKTLIHSHKNTKNVVFIADPPYLNTDCVSYKSANFWTIKEYLDILTQLNNERFIYFTSSKSGIVDLCEWLNEHTKFNLFENVKIEKKIKKGTVNYTDMMIYN